MHLEFEVDGSATIIQTYDPTRQLFLHVYSKYNLMFKRYITLSEELLHVGLIF